MIYIFIRNKLISCDSILPVAMELYEKTGLRSVFVTFDMRTYNHVAKNYFLYDSIKKIGELKYVGKTNNKYISKLNKLLFLIKLGFRVLLKKTYLIHFSHLNKGPLSILARINNQKRTFFSEPDASGFSKFMFKVDYCRRNYEYNINAETPPPKGSFLHFGQEWLWLNDERVSKIDKYHHPYPRTRSTWINHIIENTNQYMENHNTDKEIIFFIITGFCHLDIIRDENTTRRKFKETLSILKNECPNYKILVKPHPISKIEEVSEIIAEFPELDIEISYLHPSLLGYRAKVTISNFYSTAMYDSTIFGTPTIEFTDYCDEALEISGGRSQRPDHVDYFIQNDPEKFVIALKESLSQPPKEIKKLPPSKDTDFIKLFR